MVTVTVIPETPYVYHILNPRFGDDAAFVVSLADNNIINAGNTTIALDRDEQGVIPMADLVQGTLVTGTGPFDIGGAADATDVPLSVSLVGRKFVVPQVRWYYLLSPDGQASATIHTGDAVTAHVLPVGQGDGGRCRLQ